MSIFIYWKKGGRRGDSRLEDSVCQCQSCGVSVAYCTLLAGEQEWRAVGILQADCDHEGDSILTKLVKEECDTDGKMEEQKEDNVTYHTVCCQNAKRLFSYKEAPDFIKHNSFIESGYRGTLSTELCVRSVFWWTNETINIWSHIFGFVLFFAVAVRDVVSLDVYAQTSDKIIVAFVLLCFQLCMLFSSLYHTFSCRSERDCDWFLSFDLFGIALSLLAIYVSGIYYAFWCDSRLMNFYNITVTVIFILAMTLHIPSFNVKPHVRTLVFVGWAAYGVVPTLHWTFYMGGFEHPLVALLVPRVIGMYLITGTAFFIYLTKIPERFNKGKFDYLGHSHQWWHVFVVAALYYWHCTGMVYLEYRFNHACASPTNFF